MGTREVYEEKLRSGNLHHDPTLNPGLGSARCPRCLSLLNPNPEKGEWTITPVLHDATAVAGSGIGGMLSAVHGLNTGNTRVRAVAMNVTCGLVRGMKVIDMGAPLSILVGGATGRIFNELGEPIDNLGLPYLQNRLKGSKWLPFVVGLPPFLIYSVASAAFGGYVLPKFTQLTVTSYYAASSASHYGISLLTRHIEENYSSQAQQLKRP